MLFVKNKGRVAARPIKQPVKRIFMHNRKEHYAMY